MHVSFVLSTCKQSQNQRTGTFEVTENDNLSCKYCTTTTAITITAQV